jgi:hypothetical protein
MAGLRPQKKPKPPEPPVAFAKAMKDLLDDIKKQPKAPPPAELKEKKLDFMKLMGEAVKTPSKKHIQGKPLSISEVDAIRQQIKRCWNVPAGAKDAQDLVIEVALVMNPDATVRDARVIDAARMKSDPFYRAAAESARRAVLNPKCNPLKLPSEKYREWQQITLTFNPKDMF